MALHLVCFTSSKLVSQQALKGVAIPSLHFFSSQICKHDHFPCTKSWISAPVWLQRSLSNNWHSERGSDLRLLSWLPAPHHTVCAQSQNIVYSVAWVGLWVCWELSTYVWRNLSGVSRSSFRCCYFQRIWYNVITRHNSAYFMLYCIVGRRENVSFSSEEYLAKPLRMETKDNCLIQSQSLSISKMEFKP